MWTLILCCYSSSGILLLMVPLLPLLSLYIHTSQLRDKTLLASQKKVAALHKCIRGQQLFFLPRLILLVIDANVFVLITTNHAKSFVVQLIDISQYFQRRYLEFEYPFSIYQIIKKKKKKSKQSIYTCNWKKRLELNPRKNPKVLTLILQKPYKLTSQ